MIKIIAVGIFDYLNILLIQMKSLTVLISRLFRRKKDGSQAKARQEICTIKNIASFL